MQVHIIVNKFTDMLSFPSVLLAASGIACICSFLTLIVKQNLRSHLVQILTSERSPLMTEVSDWARRGGGIIKKEYLWGPKAEPLVSSVSTKATIKAARIVFVIDAIFICIAFGAFLAYAVCRIYERLGA